MNLAKVRIIIRYTNGLCRQPAVICCHLLTTPRVVPKYVTIATPTKGITNPAVNQKPFEDSCRCEMLSSSTVITSVVGSGTIITTQCSLSAIVTRARSERMDSRSQRAIILDTTRSTTPSAIVFGDDATVHSICNELLPPSALTAACFFVHLFWSGTGRQARGIDEKSKTRLAAAQRELTCKPRTHARLLLRHLSRMFFSNNGHACHPK
jgi:hypothetical protein